MALSDDLRSELAAIAPDARLLPARRGLGALPLGRERAPPRPRPGRAPSRRRHVGRRPARVLAAAAARHPFRDPHVPPPLVRPRDALPAARQRGRAGAGHARRGGRARRAPRAARAAAEAGRRTRLLPRRLPARRAARRRLALRPALAPSRAPHAPRLEGAEFLRSVAAADDVRLGVLDRGRHAVAYAKGLDAIESVLTRAGASDTVLAFEERSIVAAARAEANRLANADHANLVRTSRAAQEQLEAAAAAPAPTGRSSGCRTGCTRSPASVSATRSCRCASSRRSASPRRRKASVHRRLRKLQEMASAQR